MVEFVYKPSIEQINSTNLMRLAKKHNLSNIQALYEKADADQNWFWNSVVDDCDVSFYKRYDTVKDSSRGVPWTTWFNGGKVNIVYNTVERHSDSNDVAVRFERENGQSGDVTFFELDRLTGKLGGSLLSMGIKKGDRVGIYMPLTLESIIAMYAVMRIGAVAVPMFSGYGLEAIRTRIEDAEISVLFTTQSYERKGKKIGMIETTRKLKGVKKIVHGLTNAEEEEFDFYKLLYSGKYVKSVETDSEDPAIMLYTSGTTGKPKGTVHVHGGSLVNIVKEVKYYMDFKKGDVFFWITDLGWMMGPWAIIGANSLGGTIFVYDGAVDYPDDNRLWNLIEKNKITLLGVSPTLVRMLRFKGIEKEMKGIRVFGSTGEPWDNEGWMWLFEKLGGGKTPISNISGGTDLIGCFLASTPAIPLIPKCLYKGLGMNASVYDEEGNTIYDDVGYLVATKPFPSMTRGIWKREEKYIETYWEKFSDAWIQGDWASMNKEGYFFLYGRSDDIMKIAGKRTGPNEVEDVVMKAVGVSECAAVGIPDKIKGETIAIFYTGEDNEEVRMNVKRVVEDSLGKSFSPKVIVRLEALPKTKNGKIMRRIIKSTFLNEKIGDISNIEDVKIIENIRMEGKKHGY